MSKVVISPDGFAVSRRVDGFRSSERDVEVSVGTVIPHLQLRIAWAYGAVIEARFKGDGGATWLPCARPEFHATTEYRIKPSNPNADEIESIREEMLKLEKRLGELS